MRSSAHFIRGGQLTAGGVMQAVTSVAQTLDDADAAHEMEASARCASSTWPPPPELRPFLALAALRRGPFVFPAREVLP